MKWAFDTGYPKIGFWAWHCRPEAWLELANWLLPYPLAVRAAVLAVRTERAIAPYLLRLRVWWALRDPALRAEWLGINVALAREEREAGPPTWEQVHAAVYQHDSAAWALLHLRDLMACKGGA